MISLKELFNQKNWDYKVISNADIDNIYVSSTSLGVEKLFQSDASDCVFLQGNIIVIGIPDVEKILCIRWLKALPEVFLIVDCENEGLHGSVSELAKKYSEAVVVCVTSKTTVQEAYIGIVNEIGKEAEYTHELLYHHYINLINILTQGADIGEIEAKASEILGNPMIITDESYKVIAYSHRNEVKDPIWLTIVNNAYCPSPIVEMTDYNNFWQRLSRAGRPLFVDSDDFSPYVRRAVAEIRTYGKIKGYIALLEIDKSISKGDLQILQMIAEMVGVKLAEKDAVSKAIGQLEYEFIGDLFSGTMSNEAMARNRAQSMKLNIKDWFAVLCFETKDKDTYIGTKLDAVKNKLDSHFSMTINYLDGKKAFFIVSFKDKIKWNRLIRNEIEEFTSGNELVCSVGLPVNNMIDIHESYNQAKKTSSLIQFLSQDLRRGSLYMFSEISVYDLLLKCSRGLESYDIVSRNLTVLKELDEKAGSEYVLTLRKYFENNQNVSDTANSMYIHRNTVNYRINKIKEILEDDFDNPLVRLSLHISILMDDIKNC